MIRLLWITLGLLWITLFDFFGLLWISLKYVWIIWMTLRLCNPACVIPFTFEQFILVLVSVLKNMQGLQQSCLFLSKTTNSGKILNPTDVVLSTSHFDHYILHKKMQCAIDTAL